MIKWVMRDYFQAFHWKNNKERYKSNRWWMYIYFIFFLPLMSSELRTFEGWLGYILIMLPFLFTMFASVLQPMAMPKLMYLCPMSRDMRREYIRKSCYFRTMVPIIMSILVVAILLISGRCNWVYAAVILLNHSTLSVLLGSGINMNGYGKPDENGKRVVHMDTGNGIIELIVMVGAMFSCFLCSCYITYGMQSASAMEMQWWFLGMELLISLPLTICYIRNWSEAVERAIQYETSAHRIDANAPTKMQTSDVVRQ